MRKYSFNIHRLGAAFAALAFFIAACASDWTPIYYPPPEDKPSGPEPGESAPARECTISFTSQLCVTIKGDEIEAGTDPNEPLCTEVSPFPIHISGTEVKLIGSEFPDVKVEGHGLPAPITINAKGSGTGDANVGSGAIDASGNITIENYSFFIDVLGMIGEIPNLTLTTTATEELPDLPSISGKPPDVSGAMMLVTGTVVGPLFEAADKVLLGASLTATFSGSISPTLDQCGTNGGPKSIEIKKLFVNEKGEQAEEDLPDGNRMEVSSGTFISEGPSDIGPRFEASAKFRLKNMSSKTLQISIPSKVNAFYLSSMDALSHKLSPQQLMTITATFRPTAADTKPGEVIAPLVIGSDSFKLVAVAKSKSGEAGLSVVGEDGTLEAPNVDGVDVGSLALPANSEKDYFQCDPIKCGEMNLSTNCRPCADRTNGSCQIFVLSTTGRPIGSVDKSCAPIEPNATPRMTIDLKGTSKTQADKKIVALRNHGVADLKVTAIKLEEAPDSRSRDQFAIPPNAIFLTDRFEDIKKSAPATLPLVLSPYQEGYNDRTVFIVISYKPTDLTGFDGTQAGVGSLAKDKAILRIETDKGEITFEITGETTILEVPLLELYFKTSTGLKKVDNGKTFSFRDVTAETVDSAVPFFIKLADTASSAMRLVSIRLEGGEANFYEWLDTSEEIRSKNPPTGKGKRCSIPIIDPTTGQMTNELFDLNPVSLGSSGFNLVPGAYSTDTMPLLGCVNFHRDVTALDDEAKKKRLFSANIVVGAQELDAGGNPVKNPDGSYKQTETRSNLLAAINPITGKFVIRITQTMAAILPPQGPIISSISSKSEKLLEGVAQDSDYSIFLGTMILDPFDEETIKDASGKKIVSTPGDGITAVFRAVDTHPVDTDYEDPFLNDYASLLYDGSLPPGSRGFFEDYPNAPEGLKTSAWRIFTATLSYPGALAPEDQKPREPSDCLIVNPCSPEGLKKFIPAGVPPGEKGACAFFYASAARYDSPAFHTPEEMEGGEYQHLCNVVGQPQNLLDVNTGHYSLDGSITFEEYGFRFFGPTYLHVPGGPAGSVPPMDVVFHSAYTTDVLKPPSDPDDYNLIPDEKIDIAHQAYKINLDDPTLPVPPICPKNTKNRTIAGQKYGTWQYLAPLISKDEAGTIPAGCPEDGNNFTGGTAFLRGRRINHETGIFTVVAVGNFGPSKDLTFIFKDIMLFVVMNGWLCNPMGDEADFEGERCYDLKFNDRDAAGQISVLD